MTRKRKRNTEKANGGGYEKLREQRIKENMERLQKLGILELSLNLKKPKPQKISRKPPPPPDDQTHHNPLPLSHSPRRSARLKTMAPVSYTENRKPKKSDDDGTECEIHIEEGSKPEIYTDEQEKLLGDSQMTWILFVDGYGDDGERIYDPFNGETCHQCRQKTLGHHTHCSKCDKVQGQLCGDCLYMRYGENVIEVNQNPDWICPVCRGICNCSRCRLQNGWRPTGSVYRKVKKLGFKSVAHYLIQTRRGELTTENLVSEDSSADGGSPPESLLDEPIDTGKDSEELPKPLAEDYQDEEKKVYCLDSDDDDDDDEDDGVETDGKLN